MLNQFYIPEPDRHNAALRQYCKMENVLPGELKCPVLLQNSIRIRLEKVAFRALQLIDKSLNLMIKRLVADLEHHGNAQEYIS
jgi:hypothetical protein